MLSLDQNEIVVDPDLELRVNQISLTNQLFSSKPLNISILSKR